MWLQQPPFTWSTFKQDAQDILGQNPQNASRRRRSKSVHKDKMAFSQGKGHLLYSVLSLGLLLGYPSGDNHDLLRSIDFCIRHYELDL